jgi:uncharacterized protein YbjT (DUF2867 family)
MIVVTGATGNLGGAIARLLADAGHATRLFVRDRSRAPALPGAEIVTGDMRDPETVRAALQPGDRLFMVSVHADNPERIATHQGVIGAAQSVGAVHITYLSFLAAAEDTVSYHAVSHYATEELIRVSGLPWTFLRPSLYMEVLPRRFDGERVMRAPAGAGKATWVARADVAAVAAVVLSGEGHDGRTYDITGPESLTMAETAAVVSGVLGRDFHYVAEAPEDGWAWRRRLGQGEWEVRSRITSWQSVSAGEVARGSQDVELVTGRLPMSLAANVRANSSEFP